MAGNRLLINGIDAKNQWGVFLLDGGVDALLSPAPAKAYVTNRSRLHNGSRVIRKDSKGNSLSRIASRDVTLSFGIEAMGYSLLRSNLDNFITELIKDTTVLEIGFLQGVKFKLNYVSSTQFSQMRGRLAKIAVKFNEPNPTDRG